MCVRVDQVLLWGANVSTMNLKSARLWDQSTLSMKRWLNKHAMYCLNERQYD